MTSPDNIPPECLRAQADLVAAVVDPPVADGPESAAAHAAAHAAGCERCRSFQAARQNLWRALGELPAPPPMAGARVRFDARIARLMTDEPPRPERSRRRPSWRRAGAALTLGLAIVLGYGAGRWQQAAARQSATSRVAPTPGGAARSYLLLLYDSPALTRLSAKDLERAVAEYSAWAGDLRRAGLLTDGEKLRSDPSLWLGGRVSTTDGERIDGYFLIRASDLRAAEQIASRCPHLAWGGRIEVREIEPT